MKGQRRALYWLLVLTTGWMLTKPHLAHAYTPDLNKAAEEPASHYKSPEDLIELVPVLNRLPRTFIWSGGYVMKLSGQTLRIAHRLTRANKPVKRGDCTMGFSYVTPVAGFLTSKIDFPLFYSDTPDFSSLSFNRMGDYVTSFSRGASDSRSLRFVVSAKF
jgi:hypothetical protein